MSKLLKQLTWGLLTLSLSSAIAKSAFALPTEQQTSQTPPPVSESTGCLSGYPDGTFRGNQPVSRYEFAAGLNACLDPVNQQLEEATRNRVTSEEITDFTTSLDQYRQELNNLRQRLDSLSQ